MEDPSVDDSGDDGRLLVGFCVEDPLVDGPEDDGRFVFGWSLGKVVSIIVDAVDCDVTESIVDFRWKVNIFEIKYLN